MNEPTPAPASIAATRQGSSSDDHASPASTPEPAVAPSPDQLPTARVQAISLPLPPPVAPSGPAYKTQPLRAFETTPPVASIKARPAMANAWEKLVTASSRIAAVARAGSTERSVGVACVVLGVGAIAASLVSGWYAVDGDHFGDLKGDRATLAAAVVLARAALAIAAAAIGFGVLRVGERSLRSRADNLPRGR